MSKTNQRRDTTSIRAPVPQVIVRRIQQMIASGQVKPGEMLPSQRELASTLNASRTALREALTALETLGFIQIEPNRGAIVCSEPSTGGWRFGSRIPKDHVFQLRFVVDSYAAQLAATAANPDQVDALWRSVNEMRGSLDGGDLEAFARMDLLFHHLVAEASGNLALVHTYDSINAVMLESHRAPLTSRARLGEPVDEHMQILAAIREGDADGAFYFARRHVIRTADRSGVKKEAYSSW